MNQSSRPARGPGDRDEQWRELQAATHAAREARQQALAEVECFVADVEALLFRYDPIGLNFGDNTDEYRPEAETITPRLPSATNEAELCRVVHEEFVHWFGIDFAGAPERYADLAREIWQLWPRRASDVRTTRPGQRTTDDDDRQR